MSDTFVTASPHWTWFIIPYFFVGGIAGGACFLAAVLEWFGRPEDRPVIRTGYALAFWGAVLSGLLLTLDLGRSLRFWHMVFQSDNFPHLMFKSFSPISFGAWGLLLFGACAFLLWYAETGGTLVKLIAAVGGLLGFFVAGYTGVLLSVTNRPIWADSPWLGALFLASGASTGWHPIRSRISASRRSWRDDRALVGSLPRRRPRGLREPRGRAHARRRTRCGSGQPRCGRAAPRRRQDLLQDAVQDPEGEMLWSVSGRRHLAAEQAQRLADVRQKN